MKVSGIIETKIARVKNAMQDTAEKSTVSVSSSIRDALSLIATRHNSAMIVLDSKNLMVGIVTEKDIIIALEKHGVDILDKEVASIMSPDPLTTNLDAPCKDVLITIINGKFRNMRCMTAKPSTALSKPLRWLKENYPKFLMKIAN